MQQKSRMLDNIAPIMALIAPFLFAILAWFLAPVISLVPEIDKKIDLQAQQLLVVKDAQLEQKQEQKNMSDKVERLDDKIEDVADQVKDLERSVAK